MHAVMFVTHTYTIDNLVCLSLYHGILYFFAKIVGNGTMIVGICGTNYAWVDMGVTS